MMRISGSSALSPGTGLTNPATPAQLPAQEQPAPASQTQSPTNLPPRPTSDPLAESAMKAKVEKYGGKQILPGPIDVCKTPTPGPPVPNPYPSAGPSSTPSVEPPAKKQVGTDAPETATEEPPSGAPKEVPLSRVQSTGHEGVQFKMSSSTVVVEGNVDSLGQLVAHNAKGKAPEAQEPSQTKVVTSDNP